MYTVTTDSLRSLRVSSGGGLEQFQELKNGVVDSYGNTIQYLQGLTALTVSPDGENVYVVGTSVMPGVGGVTSLARNKASGELSLVQQFRVDQRQGIVDVPGMVGANSVGVSPNGRFVYVTSGGYYRDHNLLVFSRDRSSGGVLSLVQNIDVYNTTESRVLPTTLLVSNDGAYVYVLGNNYAISTAAILAYSVDAATGQLTQIQELGPLRATLLSTGVFEPSGKFLYATASLGSSLVLALQKLDGGVLAQLTPPTADGTAAVAPPQGSYSGALNVAMTPSGSMLFVTVEKDNALFVARRGADGKLTYSSATGIHIGRPVGASVDPSGKVLYVTSASDGAVYSFSVAE